MNTTKPEKPYSEQTAAERLAGLLAKRPLVINYDDGTVGALLSCRAEKEPKT